MIPMSLWLIGAGPHAQEYAKVLVDLGVPFEVVGRGAGSAKAFEAKIGKSVISGGLGNVLQNRSAPAAAIIAASFEQLADAALNLIRAGTKRILLEKPGGITVAELDNVAQAARVHGAQVWVGYSRRYYASTMAARKILVEDGGPVSCNFEFTEWSHQIEPMPLPVEVKNAWVIANSSHVIDLAFHLCGLPREWRGWHSGSMAWHEAAARYAGAGITDKDVMFSYHSDWQAPGRWSVEVLTRKRRLIFRPMEQLHVTSLASVAVEKVLLDDELDIRFKPGLYRQTQAFLSQDESHFCSVEAQLNHAKIYSQIAGYVVKQ
jgi:predicted dehydrogenase